MASRKVTTITTYFMRPKENSVEPESLEQRVDSQEEEEIASEFQQQVEPEIQETSGSEIQRPKRKEPASFKGDAIMKQQRTQIGAVFWSPQKKPSYLWCQYERKREKIKKYQGHQEG